MYFFCAQVVMFFVQSLHAVLRDVYIYIYANYFLVIFLLKKELLAENLKVACMDSETKHKIN
jgi:hypothetical protein